ncbi:MAG: DUF104 domain-containing protein [Methanophagales archaeon]|nr:DUF104 domain-containing protein [Methanophagales archaeon]
MRMGIRIKAIYNEGVLKPIKKIGFAGKSESEDYNQRKL